MGMDGQRVRPLPRIPGAPRLRGVFGQLLRRGAFRPEGGLAPHGGLHVAPVVPELVPAALSLRLRRLPHHRLSRVAVRVEAARAAHSILTDELALDVRAGLGGAGQKSLPSRYLYDDLGSALFEAIGHLPEYGLTRADERILRSHARDIVRAMRGPCTVAELGSGSGRKTRWLLESLGTRHPVKYYPIDISSAALDRCEQGLGRLPAVRVHPSRADHL